MFWIKRKQSLVESGLFEGFTDYHSHILPGVDDGVRSTDEALRILKWYEELGVERVVLTPHIAQLYPCNSAPYLRERFEVFRGQYQGGVELSLGAEYMLDSSFQTHLVQGDMLTVAENTLLVECSFISPPLNMLELFLLKKKAILVF